MSRIEKQQLFLKTIILLLCCCKRNLNQESWTVLLPNLFLSSISNKVVGIKVGCMRVHRTPFYKLSKKQKRMESA